MTTWTCSQVGQNPSSLWERLCGQSEDNTSTQKPHRMPNAIFTPRSVLMQSITGPTEAHLVSYTENETVAKTEAHLSLLVEAAQTGDAATFAQVSRRIEWSQRSSADFITAIHLALATGAHLTARELTTRGRRMYPEHPELRRLAHILAPPKVKVSKRASGASRRKDFAWLKQHSAQYRGQWVALKEGELVAAAATIPELKAQVASPKDIFLARVP